MSRAGRYYTPAERIEPVLGVEHEKTLGAFDMYFGEASALEKAGLLRADMLPAPGSYSTTWRPEGYKRKPGEWFHEVPGYMEVRAHISGKYKVKLVVGKEEQARRRAEAQRREQERNRQFAAQSAEWRARPEYRPVVTGLPHIPTEDEFREQAMLFLRMLRRVTLNTDNEYGPFTFELDEDEHEGLQESLDHLEELFASAPITADTTAMGQLRAARAHAKARLDLPLQRFLAQVNRKAARKKAL